ncbi:AraC family transcriptional regulator [Paenibacillus sp. MMS20-IR301]|uniref:AraC family transcriptional regulator n=1 Tax=Paenibacillus sp. MMS20-IR301 TaxID=2895946 RepID=UPI0028E40289|nr:AraC family transcriptional regulator [Paenibacillus sp. MMS20-IR301]WNS43905.1 AraC family transcriptional regulator [Paenibacillus sp. MMS20-IR301]
MNKYGYKKTIFNHLVLSYTILSVVLISAMGGYWYTQANRMMDQEIAKDSITRLNAVQTFIEQTLLKKYEDNLQNKALSINFIQSNANLSQLLYGGWKGKLSRVASFNNDLGFFKIENAGVTNVAVYFPGNDYVIDADKFYMNTANSPEAEYYWAIPQSPLKKWAVRTNADGEQVLSYVIKLPYQLPSVKAAGYFIVDVGVHYLQTIVAPMLSSPQDKLLVLDGANHVLFAAGGENSRIDELLQEALGSGSMQEKRIKEGGVPGVLSQLPSVHSAHGWTYATYRPTSTVELFTYHLKTGLFTASAVIILFGLMISFLFSKQLYVPIKQLMARIGSYQPAHSPHSRGNEYKIIGDTLSLMKDKIVDLESQARKNEIINLLLGVGQNEEQPDLVLPDTAYCAAYLQLTEGESEGLKARYELCSTLPGEFFTINAREAVILYYLEESQDCGLSVLVSDLQSLQRNSGEGLIFQAAIGRPVQTAEEIPGSYQTAQQAGRYHFIYGKHTVITYDKIHSLSAEPILFNFEHYRNALKAGDLKGVNEFLDGFVSALHKEEVQIDAAELAVFQLIAQLYQCVIELKLPQLLPYSNLFDELKKDTLHGTMSSIRTLCADIAERMNVEGNHAHAEVIRTIKAYISDHLHEDLSLQILSREVLLAPAYISSLFSEATKSPFTEYVTKLRLEKAAELLIADSRLSIAAIAEQVGYRNPQYFHSKFKARYGVTPVQYRKSHKEHGDWLALEN